MPVIKPILYCFLLISLLSTFACNDPAAIDTDIIDISLIDVQTMDDFDITSYSTLEDSIISFQPSFFLLPQYPFGIDEDPVFGTATNSIAAQYLLTQAAPDFTNAVVDSVVMELNISEDNPFYGDSTQTIGIEIVEIEETLDFNTDYYSNHVTELDGGPIGTYMGVPNFRDSVAVGRWVSDSLIFDTFPPQLRIKMVNSFGQRVLFSPAGTLENNVEFLALFPGLYLRPTIPNNGMMAFDFNSFDTANESSLSGASVQIYYTQNGVRNQYELAVSSVLSVKLEDQTSDITGSMVEEFLDDETLGDSLVFVQGMLGPNAVVRLNDVDRLEGAIINGATLDVYATALNGDEDIRSVPDQLILRELAADGSLDFSRDFITALSAGGVEIAGGEPEDIGGGIYKYSFNVAGQLQDIIEGIKPNEIYIRANTKVANLRRAVIFGAGHSTHPMRLNVTYTNL